jgi:hypothetical protein
MNFPTAKYARLALAAAVICSLPPEGASSFIGKQLTEAIFLSTNTYVFMTALVLPNRNPRKTKHCRYAILLVCNTSKYF